MEFNRNIQTQHHDQLEEASVTVGVELVSVEDKRAWSVFNVVLDANTPIMTLLYNY